MSKLHAHYLLNVIICLLTVDKRRPSFIQEYYKGFDKMGTKDFFCYFLLSLNANYRHDVLFKCFQEPSWLYLILEVV